MLPTHFSIFYFLICKINCSLTKYLDLLSHGESHSQATGILVNSTNRRGNIGNKVLESMFLSLILNYYLDGKFCC